MRTAHGSPKMIGMPAGEQSYLGAACSSKAAMRALPPAVMSRLAPAAFISGQTSEFAGTQRRPANVPEILGTPAGTTGDWDWVKTTAKPVVASATINATAREKDFMRLM